MTSKDTATGFAQEIPGGFVFEIGNGALTRRIYATSGRLTTASLINNSHAEEYLDETNSEFEIELVGGGQQVILNQKDFTCVGYETPNWDDSRRTVQAKLEADLADGLLRVSVFYEARAGEDFISKWVQVHPFEIEGWSVRSVTIDDLKLKEMVEGVVPQIRYLRQTESHEDQVHSEPDKVNTAEPQRRLMYGDLARSVVTYWGYGEGLYFFTKSLLGSERYHRPTGLVMKDRASVPVTQGFTTGRAIIGAYTGAPELGFKRYNEFLAENWLAITGKTLPVEWNTWFVTLPGNKPLMADYSYGYLVEQLELLKTAGFYDVLHLDLGWEADYPLKADARKFPKGLSEIARRAKNDAGLDMAYWVNPFSQSYWRSKIEAEHPEYLVPGKTSPRSGASAICVMTGHADYVRERLFALGSEFSARLIYWDGNDWNIPECTARNHDHGDQPELQAKAWRRLAEICDAAHAARPDLLIACFSLPFDNHRLAWVDQEQVSDTYSFPIVQSELIQRQQIYQMTFEHPYKAIRGSWYGVGWHEAGDSDLAERSMRELIHAEMSMIGNGLVQAGGSFDLKQASPEFMEFLKKLFAFRKRFERYFDVYQHVLGFPDGRQVDGEGHIVDGSGFIILVNPTREEQTVKIPLAEVELELSCEKRHELTDWSRLEAGVPLGSFAPDNAPEVDLVSLEVKYIGVNLK